MREPFMPIVEPAGEVDLPEIVEMISSHFGHPDLLSFGVHYHPRDLSHLVIRDGRALGACASWVVAKDSVRVPSVQVETAFRGAGLGLALSEAIERTAVRERCTRLENSVTNDNLPALGFWQRSGYRITGIAVGEVERLLQSFGLPTRAVRGLPIRDEIRLEKRLPGGRWIGLSDGRDGAAIEALLQESGLPVPKSRAGFVVAAEGDRVLGCAGYEPHGAAAIVRSVAVVPESRRERLGKQLVEHLLTLLERWRVREAWLLTLAAAPFFERLGFERTTRDAAPESLHASEEFKADCCASAVVMRRRCASEASRRA